MLNFSDIWRTETDPEQRVSAVIRLFAGFEILLLISTWPLWWGGSEFPQVPLLPISIPVELGRWMTAGLLLSASCVVVVRSPKLLRISVLAAAIFGAFLTVQNQHRLQAWHWLFLIISSGWLILPAGNRLPWMRHAVSAVYVCSALSRLTPNPVTGMTSAIVYQILATIKIQGLAPDSSAMVLLCHVMTIGELLIGVLLLFSRTRGFVVIAAILLHVVLMIVLSPLGLNHHAGVILWNACLLCVVSVLFAGPDKSVKPQSHLQQQPKSRATSLTACCVLAVTWLFPISGLFGIADNWPSWQLYSSRPESWVLYIHRDSLQALPKNLTSYIAPPAPPADFFAIRLDRWSLDQTGSPMYPEDRFQAAVIEMVLGSLSTNAQFQIILTTPRSPDWWHRDERRISTREELEVGQRSFYLNTTAQ